MSNGVHIYKYKCVWRHHNRRINKVGGVAPWLSKVPPQLTAAVGGVARHTLYTLHTVTILSRVFKLIYDVYFVTQIPYDVICLSHLDN